MRLVRSWPQCSDHTHKEFSRFSYTLTKGLVLLSWDITVKILGHKRITTLQVYLLSSTSFLELFSLRQPWDCIHLSPDLTTTGSSCSSCDIQKVFFSLSNLWLKYSQPVLHLLVCCLVQLTTPCWLCPVTSLHLCITTVLISSRGKRQSTTDVPMILLYFSHDSLTEYSHFILTFLAVQDTALLLPSFLSPVTSRSFEYSWFTSFSLEFFIMNSFSSSLQM